MNSEDKQTNKTAGSNVTRIPTHLAEGRFTKYDAEDPVVRDVLAAQARARVAMDKILEVHDLSMSNPLQTPLANLRSSKKHAEKRLAEVLPVMDAQRKRTQSVVDSLQREIDDSLEQGALHWPFAKETREHVKSLPEEERVAFVSDALRRGDTRAAAAVIGVPGYLSGLPESARELCLHQYKAEAFPDHAARIKSLSEAQQILDDGGSAMLSSVQELFKSADLDAAEKHATKLNEAQAS